MNATLKDIGTQETAYTILTAILGQEVTSEVDTYRMAEKGLTPKAIKHLIGALQIPADLIAPETTVRRRLKHKTTFSSAESERALRLARVYAEAKLLFGDDAATQAWFRKPAVLVQGQPPMPPMELAASEIGARLVESKIRRTAYGMF